MNFKTNHKDVRDAIICVLIVLLCAIDALLYFSLESRISAIVFFWISCGIVGSVLSDKKGRCGIGFSLGLILGPLGVIISFFLPDSKMKRHLEERRSAEQSELLRELMELQRGSCGDESPFIRAAKDGKDMGNMTIRAVRRMVMEGGMSLDDLYLDPISSEWRPLRDHPWL
jgi:hypothetical protein